MTLEYRVAEINERYGPNHTTAQAINQGVPEFERARAETERRMAEAGIVISR